MAEPNLVAGLIQATPYFAEGFALNLGISLGAMALGTALGVPIGACRRGATKLPAEGLTQLTRNVPSFVLLFFLAAVLPEQLELGPLLWPLDGATTAVLALTIPVAGFTSDATRSLLAEPPGARRGRLSALTLAYVQYFVVIIMASATASVIGVEELVARSNHLVSQEIEVGGMLAVYLYAAAWFVITGTVLLFLGKLAASAVQGSARPGPASPAPDGFHSR